MRFHLKTPAAKTQQVGELFSLHDGSISTGSSLTGTDASPPTALFPALVATPELVSNVGTGERVISGDWVVVAGEKTLFMARDGGCAMVTTTTLVRGAVELIPLVWSPLWEGAVVTILTRVGVEPTMLFVPPPLPLLLAAADARGLGGADRRGGLDVTITYFCGVPESVAVGNRGA